MMKNPQNQPVQPSVDATSNMMQHKEPQAYKANATKKPKK